MFDVRPDHRVKDVPLVHVDGDQCLVLLPLHLLQVLGGLADQQVEHVEEPAVGVGHDLLVLAAAAEGRLGIPGLTQVAAAFPELPGPDHLDAEDADLGLELVDHLQQAELVVVDVVEALPAQGARLSERAGTWELHSKGEPKFLKAISVCPDGNRP